MFTPTSPMKKAFLFCVCLTIFLPEITAQTYSLKVTASVANDVLDRFENSGRIFLFVNPGTRGEPRMNTFPDKSNYIFATNIKNWDTNADFVFDGSADVVKSVDVSLNSLPAGKYRVQLLWDQDTKESRINAPGNLYSEPIDVDLQQNKTIAIPLKEVIAPRTLSESKYLKEVNLKSQLLSDW